MNQLPENTLQEHQPQPVQEIPPPGRITAMSETQYREKSEAVKRYSIAKRSFDPEEPVGVTVLEAVQDLAARRDLTASSLMTYRSSMLWYLRQLQDQSEMNRTAYAILLELRPVDDAKQSREKKRAISEADYHELIAELGEMGPTSVWAVRAQAWVQATLASGARPIEWLDARFTDAEETELEITTAKHHLEAPRFLPPPPLHPDHAHPELQTNPAAAPGDVATQGPADAGREIHEEEGFQAEGPEMQDDDELDQSGQLSPMRVAGPKRLIPLAAGMDRLATQTHLAYFTRVVSLDLPAEQRVDGFRRYHDQCRRVLRKACQRLWKGKRNYTLYTMRSQFQANQRARLGAAGTAGLMGHSTDKSPSTAHYGKANQAFSRFKGERAANQAQAEARTEVDQGGREQGSEQGSADAADASPPYST